MATEKRESKGKPEIRAVRRGNTRHFYRGGREVARYRVRPDRVPVGVSLGARELKEDEESTRTFLECFLPKNLAKAVVEHAKEDLGVR